VNAYSFFYFIGESFCKEGDGMIRTLFAILGVLFLVKIATPVVLALAVPALALVGVVTIIRYGFKKLRRKQR